MFVILMLAGFFVYAKLRLWVHDRPTSGFRQGVFRLFGEAVVVAFLFWMCVIGPPLLNRIQSLDRVAHEARSALAKTISSSSSTPSWSD